MANKRKVSIQMHQRLEEVARHRLSIPSNKQLAWELGCSVATVECYISRYIRKVRESLVSRGADAAKIEHQAFCK